MVESIIPSLVDFDDNSEIYHILRAVFSVSKKQLECFLQLRLKKKTGSCIKNLFEEEKYDRSIIQKHLKVLCEKGLANRESVSLSEFQKRCEEYDLDNRTRTNKGYLYIYSSISDEELLDKIDKTLRNWKKFIKIYLKGN